MCAASESSAERLRRAMPATTSTAISPTSSAECDPQRGRPRRRPARASARGRGGRALTTLHDERLRAGYVHSLATSRSHPRVLMGLLFYPRGGSAHVARNLAHDAARASGWDVTILSGSVTLRPPGDARRFYHDLDVRPVDMTPRARARRSDGRRPADAPVLRGPPGRARPLLRPARRRGRRAPGRRVDARAAVRGRGRTPTSCTCTT